MANIDTEQKKIIDSIRSAGLCVTRHIFAYKAGMSQLKTNVSKKELAGAMPVLSMHDPRVMYVPICMLWPTQLKKCLFFPTYKPGGSGGSGSKSSKKSQQQQQEDATYECDSLLSYAVLVGKESLAGFFDEVYASVYTTTHATHCGEDDDGEMTASQLMKKFVESDYMKCKKENDDTESFRSDYTSPPPEADSDNEEDDDSDTASEDNDDENDSRKKKKKKKQKKAAAAKQQKQQLPFIEDELEENEVLVVYMTETKLAQHGVNGTPFTFTEPVQLDEPDIHLPHTPTNHLYGSSKKLGEGQLELRCSLTVLQDMLEFSLLSLCMSKTFETLQKFSKFVFGLKQSKFSEKNDNYRVDGNKIAIRLRLHQEGVADLTTTGVAGYFNMTDALCFHRKWINLLIGDRTGMNSAFPRRSTAGKTVFTISDPVRAPIPPAPLRRSRRTRKAPQRLTY